jgi:hypothetical protein
MTPLQAFESANFAGLPTITRVAILCAGLVLLSAIPMLSRGILYLSLILLAVVLMEWQQGVTLT